MMAAGLSVRGLSVVTITWSAPAHGDLTHERPLAAVAVAAAPEDDEETARLEVPERRDDLLERVGRVRVVDHGREVLAAVHELEPPLDAVHLIEPGDDGVLPDALRHGDARRGQRVHDVERRDEPDPHVELAGRRDEPRLGAARPCSSRTPCERRRPSSRR